MIRAISSRSRLMALKLSMMGWERNPWLAIFSESKQGFVGREESAEVYAILLICLLDRGAKAEEVEARRKPRGLNLWSPATIRSLSRSRRNRPPFLAQLSAPKKKMTQQRCKCEVENLQESNGVLRRTSRRYGEEEKRQDKKKFLLKVKKMKKGERVKFWCNKVYV